MRALAAGLLAVLASLAVCRPAGAADAASGPVPRVVAIEVEGARRTRRATVLTLARVREGRPWAPGDAAAARQLLLNAGIFYEVSVDAEPAEGGVRVRIRLREKWTLIPLPLFSVKDGQTTWGAAVIESNLLGTATRLIGILAVRDGEPGGRLLYIDQHVGGSRLQLFGSLAHTDERTGLWDAEEEVGSYRRRASAGTLAVGYRFAPRTSVSLGLRAADFSFREAREGVEPPADARERAVALMLRHEGTDVEEERRRGLSADLRFERGASFLGDRVDRTELGGSLRWAYTHPGGDTTGLEGHALWTDTVDYLEGSRPPAAFLRGYDPARFRPDRLLGGSVEHQVPVARFREATLSVVPFADAALLRDRFHAFAPADAQVDAGLALAVYVRRVALPVLQLYAAYGFATGEISPGFALGFGF